MYVYMGIKIYDNNSIYSWINGYLDYVDSIIYICPRTIFLKPYSQWHDQ